MNIREKSNLDSILSQIIYSYYKFIYETVYL